MGFASLAAVGAVVLLLCGLTAALLVLVLRQRAATETELARAHAETAELRQRLETLAVCLERAAAAGAGSAPGAGSAAGTTEGRPRHGDRAVSAYVITGAGTAGLPAPVTVPDRVVLSTTLGEPLVKAAALGHGLRRALSAETRNRIRFEVRREVRAARRRRRRDARALAREARAAQRGTEQATERSDHAPDAA